MPEFTITFQQMIFTARQPSLWEGRASVFTCVCLFTGGGVRVTPYVTINHDALDLTVQALWPCTPPPKSDLIPLDIRTGTSPAPLNIRSPSPMLVTSEGHHWRSVQTCTFEDSLQWVYIW